MREKRREAPHGIIRYASLPDLDAVEALEDAVFRGDRLSRRSLRYYIDAPTAVFLVLHSQDRLAGDAILAFRRGSTLARLYSIAVDPAFAGQRFGSRLLDRCEAEATARGADRLRLEVRMDNAAAVHLYGRAGYTAFGQYDDYYEDGAVALRFEKRLSPGIHRNGQAGSPGER